MNTEPYTFFTFHWNKQQYLQKWSYASMCSCHSNRSTGCPGNWGTTFPGCRCIWPWRRRHGYQLPWSMRGQTEPGVDNRLLYTGTKNVKKNIERPSSKQLIYSGGFRGGGRAGSAPPPGRRMTPSLAVMLANAKFWSFYCKIWYSEYSKWLPPVAFWQL